MHKHTLQAKHLTDGCSYGDAKTDLVLKNNTDSIAFVCLWLVDDVAS